MTLNRVGVISNKSPFFGCHQNSKTKPIECLHPKHNVEPFSRYSPEYRKARDTAFAISALSTLLIAGVLALTSRWTHKPEQPVQPPVPVTSAVNK